MQNPGCVHCCLDHREHRINIDLHTHSTASDGRFTPTELVHAAAEAGVDCLSLTDHDTCAGLATARSAARDSGVKLINGVEISVTWQRRTLHVVGLAIDPESPTLAGGLNHHQQLRTSRALAIAAKLEKLGVPDAYEQALELAAGGQITRSHFARLLIRSGKAKSMQQCFKRYLKPGKPGYASVEWAGLGDVVNWIHTAGGVAVLAHPLAYGMTAAWRRRMLAAFAEAGGDALEVHCGSSSAEDVRLAAGYADQYELLGSVGSDFHGPQQKWLRLGRPLPLPPQVTPVWSHPRMALG